MKTSDKLSDAIVRDLTPPATGNKIHYDKGPDAVRGFGVRITASGQRSFVLNYVAAGRERRMTIGAYPAWKVAAARKEAMQLRQDIDRGIDPLADRNAEREAPTVNDLADRYLDEWAKPKKRPGPAAADESNLRRLVRPEIGKLKVQAVAYADVDRLHRKVSKTAGPYQGNRVLGLLSKMFSLAVLWKMRDDNPARGISRNHEEARERYIEGEELQRLTEALAAHPDQQVANALRLLLLTGARRGELLSATWDMFDLEMGIWVKPSAHTKQKRVHRVPLSAPAMMLLSEIRAEAEQDARAKGRAVSPRVFPAPLGADQMVAPLKRGWKAICKTAGIDGTRVHDLRHSYASFLVNSGLSLPIIGRLMGHVQVATTQRYAHLADDPLRAATERVGAIVTGKDKGGEVVPLGKRRARR
jgi:integrase